MAASDVASKDVVIAALGTATGLAGFILVFLGVVIGGYASYDATQKRAVRTFYRVIGGFAIAAFFLSVVTVALGLRWLAYRQPDSTYHWVLRLLFADLPLVLVIGVVTTVRAFKD